MAMTTKPPVPHFADASRLGWHSFRPYPEARFAHPGRKPAVSAPYAPRQNQLLAALPAEDYERLLPDLEPVALPLGWTIYGAGEREKYLYLLTAGIVSQFYVTQDGASAEFAITGSEGVIGVASILGGESTPSQAVVLNSGYAYRLDAESLKGELEHVGPLQQLLLRYMQALIEQAGQVAVCNRHHSLEQRVCRWILSCLDRSPSNVLTMTHKLIADMLGVRREGITEAAGKLQQAGLICCRRRYLAVLDRPRLEARTCECYAVVKREYDRLLPRSRPAEAVS